MKTSATIGLVLAALFASRARAEVADSAANGFTLRTTVNIQAPINEVYGRIIHNIGDWWSPKHTYSGDAHNLSIEEKAMGCFCEKLPGPGAIRHMQVVGLFPGKTIMLTGALGPLESIAAAGNMEIQLTAIQGGTKLQLTYAVIGYLPAGMNTWAAPVDSVLTEQFTRLKNYVEHGDPNFNK